VADSFNVDLDRLHDTATSDLPYITDGVAAAHRNRPGPGRERGNRPAHPVGSDTRADRPIPLHIGLTAGRGRDPRGTRNGGCGCPQNYRRGTAFGPDRAGVVRREGSQTGVSDRRHTGSPGSSRRWSGYPCSWPFGL